MNKRFLTIWIIAILTLLMGGNTVIADEDLDPSIDGDTGVAGCISKGNLEFALFLNTLAWDDGIIQGIYQPWEDVLTRNQCHSNDISALIHQRDKVRSQIRDAFLSCNTQKLPDMKKRYYSLNAEVYYVRHVVDGGVVATLPYDVLNSRDLGIFESAYYDEGKLYSEMKEQYVDEEEFTLTDFDILYESLKIKYNDKKNQYIVCDNSSWDQISEKWQEFMDSAGGTADAWEDLGTVVEGRADKIVQSVSDVSFASYFEGLVQANINDMDAKAGALELREELQKNLPSYHTPTQSDLLGAIGSSDRAFEIELMEKEISARFKVLYLDTGDSTIELFVDELENLNQIIIDSYKPMGLVLDCSETMNARQCAQ